MDPINPAFNVNRPRDLDPEQLEFPLPDTDMLISEMHYVNEHLITGPEGSSMDSLD